MSKEPAAGDEVLWFIQLEQEKLSGLQSAKQLLPARLPEIDLVNIGKLA